MKHILKADKSDKLIKRIADKSGLPYNQVSNFNLRRVSFKFSTERTLLFLKAAISVLSERKEELNYTMSNIDQLQIQIDNLRDKVAKEMQKREDESSFISNMIKDAGV